MFIEDESLDLLFTDAAKRVTETVPQPREAIMRLARQRLEDNINDIAAIHVIAAARIQHRQPARSLELLQQHDAALEYNAIGHRLAGYAHLAQGQIRQARAHFRATVQLDPTLHDCWTWLGKIDEQNGLIDQAIAFHQRALYFAKNDHESALALARLFAQTNRLKRAIATLRSVLRGDRRSASLNAALAALLQQRAVKLRRRGKPRAEDAVLRQALDCLQTSLAAAPQPETYLALGRLQKRLGNFTEAAAAFSKAVKFNDRSPTAITQLANTAIENGKLEEAVTLYGRALSIAPDFAPAHFKYSRAQRFKDEKTTRTYLNWLAELVSNHARPARDQVQLNFALAKVLDDIGQYDRAWQHYDRANRLKPGHSDNLRSGSSARREAHCPLREVVDGAIKYFSPDLFAAHRGVGNRSDSPIFIVGMPRSGTTLTEQIVSSHPEVAGAGELKSIERIRQQIANHSVSRGTDKYPDLISRIAPEALRGFADQHVSYLQQLGGDARFVTDKMPTNFIHLGLIAVLFPNATIIHCRRDPMDVLVSSYCQNLSPPFCDLRALARYHQQYRRLMAHWRQVLPNKIHAVDYESLVTDPEINSRRLVEACGLTWDERCLNFQANQRAVHTPSKWQVRQPMYQSSVGKWKRFESHLQHIAKLVGRDYEPAVAESSSEFQSSVV